MQTRTNPRLLRFFSTRTFHHPVHGQLYNGYRNTHTSSTASVAPYRDSHWPWIFLVDLLYDVDL